MGLVLVSAINKWLNKVAGNKGHEQEMGEQESATVLGMVTIFLGFFQNIADGMKFLTKEHMKPLKSWTK